MYINPKKIKHKVKLPSIVVALPPAANTGWGTASRRITEELKKIAAVNDIRTADILTNTSRVSFNVPVLQAMRGGDLLPFYPQIHAPWPVGYCFIEDNILMRQYRMNADEYSQIVCGSTWASEQMREIASPDRVSMAIQGVDTDVFSPADDLRPDPDWFTIWSAGKFELRKSQDVVIRAVQVMMERHKDVRLVTSWWNPWPVTIDTMKDSSLIDFHGWDGSSLQSSLAASNSACMDMSRVTFLPALPHGASVHSIRSADVGLFLSRCEAGTNLPLMEAMSCGLAVIATGDHGHRDVTAHMDSGMDRELRIPGKAYTVKRGGEEVAEWVEPDLDAVVEALDLAYRSRDELKGCGQRNREFIKRFTWAACARNLLDACTNAKKKS